MTDASDDVPSAQHAEHGANSEIADQAGAETNNDNANHDAQQEQGKEVHSGDTSVEVTVKQEPGEDQPSENSEPVPNEELPLNPRLASNEQWKQRAVLGTESQDNGNERQNPAPASTNPYADCGLPRPEVQAQQAHDIPNDYAQQHSPSQSAPDHFGKRPSWLDMPLQMPPPHFQYQSPSSAYGHAGGMPGMDGTYPGYLVRDYPPMPPMHMHPGFHPHSSVPPWAQQAPRLPPSSGYGWSAPSPAMDHNLGSSSGAARDFYDQSEHSDTSDEEDEEDEDLEMSDDDGPLTTRVQRHPSASISATDRVSHPPVSAAGEISRGNIQDTIEVDQHGEEEIPGTSSPSKPEAFTTQQPSNVINISSASSSPEPISWKLPAFEILPIPGETKHDLSSAKISIPGLVREELVLSPDHPDQELLLFTHVFLPAQRALAVPDPQPAHAVLNFHTIANLVIEAFTQYEIGDEVSLGPSQHRPAPTTPAPDAAFARTHSARTADVDAIFFAVVDRWRAGLETGKVALKLVRGAQEFCDVALDVIHYVKANGLYEAVVARKERCDKGVARGPRAKSGDGVVGKGGRKRGAEGETDGANTLQARKKVKSGKEKEKEKGRAKPGPKPKAKAAPKPRAKKVKDVGVTVIRREK